MANECANRGSSPRYKSGTLTAGYHVRPCPENLELRAAFRKGNEADKRTRGGRDPPAVERASAAGSEEPAGVQR
jgi:hypothetical protein